MGLSSNLPRIHAHRGCREKAPENTIPAFQIAIELGADGIEFDLHCTKDSGIVVHHDAYLGRTSNGDGLVADHTLSELASLDAGSWYGAGYAGAKIPQLHEVLGIANGKCVLEAELKAISERFIESVLDTIEAHGLGEQVEITSSFLHLLMKVRMLHSSIKIGVLLERPPPWMGDELWLMRSIDSMELIGAQVAHLPSGLVNGETVRAFQEDGFLVHAADCNTEAEIVNAISTGVNQLTTDELLLALEMRSTLSGSAERNSRFAGR